MFNNVGATLFIWGFNVPSDRFFVREVGLCNIQGSRHACFKYNLPRFSDTDIPYMRNQQVWNHGLHYRNNDCYRESNLVQSDIFNWLKTVLTEERPKVAVHTGGFSPLVKLDLPVVTITENGCPNLKDLPIGSIKAFPSGQYRLLCSSHGTGDV